MGDDQEYIELFRAEAHDNFESLERLLTSLESDKGNFVHIDEIFRIIHTLKGNAMALGLQGISEISHVLEDIFGSVKQKKVKLSKDLVALLFKAIDKLGHLITALKTGEKIAYKGIRTRLQIFYKKSLDA